MKINFKFIIFVLPVLIVFCSCSSIYKKKKYTPKSLSQIEVTDPVLKLSSKMGKIDTSEDLITLRNIMYSHLKVRSINIFTWIPEARIRWRRTASDIIQDGYVYKGKSCTDYVIVYIALCNAKGLETKFVKIYKKGGPIHSIAEIKLSDGWYHFDVSRSRSKPKRGKLSHITVDNGWEIWNKGRDAWALGLDSYHSILKIIF